MRSNYFFRKLTDMADFNGFFGRSFLPQNKIYKKDADGNYSYATQTLFFINSTNEIFVDVGLDFPVVPLGVSDI